LTIQAIYSLSQVGLSPLNGRNLALIINDPSNFLSELFTPGWKALSLAPPHSLHLNGSKSAVDETGTELNVLRTGNLPELPSRWMFPKCGDEATWNDGDGKS
jgi:hypothetical protein